MPISKIFSRLIGNWTFTRQIQDYLNPTLCGEVIGTASFTNTGEHQLTLSETGEFVISNKQPIPVSYQFLFLFNPLQQTITIHGPEHQFNKGPLFNLAFSPDMLSATTIKAQHVCAADTYDATFEFPNLVDFDSFNITYKVSGPKKNYISSTVFKLRS